MPAAREYAVPAAEAQPRAPPSAAGSSRRIGATRQRVDERRAREVLERHAEQRQHAAPAGVSTSGSPGMAAIGTAAAAIASRSGRA